MSDRSERLKNKIRDKVERKFDKLHRIADVMTAPLAPIDGLIHGTARGILNWLTDTHPGERKNKADAGEPTGYEESQEIQAVANGSLSKNKFIDAKITNKRESTPAPRAPNQSYHRKQGIQNVKDGGSLHDNDYTGAILTNE